MAKHNDTGKWGEDIAAEYLTAKGYAIADRNWHENNYEIDIVAYKNNRIVFVEVKTRSNDEEDPLLAVDAKKVLNIVKAARVYVESNEINHDVQIDLIAISGTIDDHTIEHVADAVMPPLHTYR